ncbi:hypothetical protein GQ457_18G023320 [Hibiscus cannabinus]
MIIDCLAVLCDTDEQKGVDLSFAEYLPPSHPDVSILNPTVEVARLWESSHVMWKKYGFMSRQYLYSVHCDWVRSLKWLVWTRNLVLYAYKQ